MNPIPERPMEHGGAPQPPPRGGHHHPPLEARTNWGPWLPATEAYPEVSRPLRILAMTVLALGVIVGLVLLLGLM